MGANVTLPEKSHSSNKSARAGDDVERREKKKKFSKLATFKKRLSRVKRHTRGTDHTRCFREHVSGWSPRELHDLVAEYESCAALKELAVAADLARPTAPSLRHDLAALFRSKRFADVQLLYKGGVFPAHRCILQARCDYFRELLQVGKSQAEVQINTPGVDWALFESLLLYLYTGELHMLPVTHSDTRTSARSSELFRQLCREFGTPPKLEQDMAALYRRAHGYDVVITFTSDSRESGTMYTSSSEVSEYHCHRAILAARSPFFRRMLSRREEQSAPWRVVLDDRVFDKRYVKAILHSMYTDELDFSCVANMSSSLCSLSEAQAIVSGKACSSQVDDAMELYFLGQLLEFPVLMQNCEDVIADALSLETVLHVLQWASEAHGSIWVLRQATHFLLDEFMQVLGSGVLLDLPLNTLLQLVSSDFLQAGEADVLCAVVRWGEHQLLKRLEEREPNLLTHTAHSVSRKGVKKRDLNDSELQDILSPLMPHVRLFHVLPAGADVISSAARRGLVTQLPPHYYEPGENAKSFGWIRGRSRKGVPFLRPRLYAPFYEEATSLLAERLASVPSDPLLPPLRLTSAASLPEGLHALQSPAARVTTVDVLGGRVPVPDSSSMMLMRQREQSLLESRSSQLALDLPCTERRKVMLYVQLRVVREFGLPDACTELLSAHCPLDPLLPGRSPSTLPSAASLPSANVSLLSDCACDLTELSSLGTRATATDVLTALEGPTLNFGVEGQTTLSSSSSQGAASDTLPDVANSLSQVTIHEPDLGDGASHSGTIYL